MAQKQKRYREKLKTNGLHSAMKAKNHARMKIARRKLSDFQREQYRKRDARAHRSARAAKRFQLKHVVLTCLDHMNHINPFISSVHHSVPSKVLEKLSSKWLNVFLKSHKKKD